MWIELSMVELRLSGPRRAVEVLDEAAARVPSFSRDEDFIMIKESLGSQLQQQQERGEEDRGGDAIL